MTITIRIKYTEWRIIEPASMMVIECSTGILSTVKYAANHKSVQQKSIFTIRLIATSYSLSEFRHSNA